MDEMKEMNGIDEIGMGGVNAGCEDQVKNWKMVEGSVEMEARCWWKVDWRAILGRNLVASYEKNL